MANWSDTCVRLHGKKENVEAAYNELSGWLGDEGGLWVSDEQLQEAFGISKERRDVGYSYMEVGNMDIVNDELFLDGAGRWHGPYSLIESIVAKHGLSGTYFDAECGCNFVHKMTFVDGELVSDQEDEYLSQLHADEVGLWELAEEYIHYAEDEDSHEYLEEIKDKFVSFGANRDEVEDFFKREEAS